MMMRPALTYFLSVLSVLCVLVLCTHSLKAQQIIDGSFEDNTAPFYTGGFIDTNYFKKVKMISPTGFVFRGLFYIKNDMGPYINGLNWGIAPNGNTYLFLKYTANKEDKLALTFTQPLMKGKRYVLRWNGSCQNKTGKVLDTVRIELGTNILHPGKQFFGHLPVSTTDYREYTFSFTADSNYQYLFFSQDTLRSIPYNDRAIIDNVRLDTCVQVLPKRTLGCITFPYVLPAAIVGKHYLWNTGDTLQSITTNQEGLYMASVYDSTGCVIMDSVEVVSSPVTSPATFTSKQLCVGDSIRLTSANAGTYTWNNGATTQSIFVKDSGVYWVHTVTAGGCDGIDSFKVLQQTPQPVLHLHDTSFCNPNSITINTYTPFYTSYVWSTGSHDSAITITASGMYKITGSNGVCTISDSISATRIDLTTTQTDTSLCSGKQITLTAKAVEKYRWNTGDTTQSITVNTPALYWVNKTQKGCSAIDSFMVTAIEQPTSSTTDTFYCATQVVTVSATTAQTYLWNTGQQIQSININSPGLYTVVKHNQQCTGIDSFYVTEKSLPIITTLQDTTVCFDEVAQILLDAGHFKSYLWKPTGETTQTIYSTTAQVYILTVTDSNNCSTSKQVAVMETCPDFVYIPNAFTPNNDGINDVFLPKTRSLEEYELSIINRWGAVVFKTKNPQQAWDGKDAQEGVYVVTVNYKVAGKPVKTVTQNVTLLR